MDARPEIRHLKTSEHGGLNYSELEATGIAPGEVIDFSVSSNPNGPPPGLRVTTKGVRIERYPDSEANELRRCLGGKLGIEPRNILVGSGSTELIRLAALAYLGKGDTAVVIQPTFGEYEVACNIMGGQIVRQQLALDDGFSLDTGSMVEMVKRHKPKVIFINNPNNPTGNYVSRHDFEKLLAAAPDSLIVLDEAYVSFVENAWSPVDLTHDSNLLVLRSMTKDYALAGLRLGYAIGRKEIIDSLRRVCPPWNVNSIAQQAGLLVLQQDDFLRRSRAIAARSKKYLMGELTRLGFRCLPSEANFFLVEVGDAAGFRRRLLGKKMLVRDCTSFGLPGYIRLAPRDPRACRRLIAAIEELQAE